MELKRYQEEAVGKLALSVRGLLAKGGTRVCVLKAPTGSGKTIMVADFLRRLPEEIPDARFAFVWISSNALHEQSFDKVGRYLADTRYKLDLLENVATDTLSQNQIVFVNWESLTRQNREGEFTNLMMREGEGGRGLPSIIEKTKEAGLEIFLVVDESHYRYWSVRSQELVQSVIGIEISEEYAEIAEARIVATEAATRPATPRSTPDTGNAPSGDDSAA